MATRDAANIGHFSTCHLPLGGKLDGKKPIFAPSHALLAMESPMMAATSGSPGF